MLEVYFTTREELVLGEEKAVEDDLIKKKDLSGFGLRLVILNEPC